MKRSQLTNLILSGVMAALTFAGTFLLKVPTVTGYIHLGDIGVCLAASLLPTPYAFAAAAVGGALSDLVAGYAMYIPATFLLKGLMTLAFSSRGEKIFTRRNLLAALLGAVITVVGYYVAEVILMLLSGSGWGQAAAGSLVTIPGNALQGVANAAVYLILAVALDRFGFRTRLQAWKK